MPTEQNGLPWWRRQWVHRMAAYIGIVAIGSLGFWETNVRQDTDDQQAYENCVAIQELASGFRDAWTYVADLTGAQDEILEEVLAFAPERDCPKP
jgi:hypothetical protein